MTPLVNKYRAERPELIKLLKNDIKLVCKDSLEDAVKIHIPMMCKILDSNLELRGFGWECPFRCYSPIPCSDIFDATTKKGIVQVSLQEFIQIVLDYRIQIFEEVSKYPIKDIIIKNEEQS